jgi:hypothetical protein
VTPGNLLVGVDRGTVQTLTVFALAPNGSGGTVVIIPTRTEVTQQGGSNQAPVASAYTASDPSSADVTDAVENLLGVNMSSTTTADHDQLTALFAPYAPFQVQVDDDVIATDANGKDHVLFKAGNLQLDASDAASFLLATTDAQSEVARLPRLQAFWQAVLTAVAAKSSTSTSSGSTTATTTGAAAAAPTDSSGFLSAIGAGASGVQLLPVAPLPASPDLLQANSAATRLLMAQVLPGAVSTAGTGPRVRLVNSLGDPSLSLDASGRILLYNATLVLAGVTSDAPPDHTIYEWTTDLGQQSEGMAKVFGDATVVRKSDQPIDGIDVTIILGRDYPAIVAAANAATTTTSIASSTVPAPTTTIGRHTTTTARRHR